MYYKLEQELQLAGYEILDLDYGDNVSHYYIVNFDGSRITQGDLDEIYEIASMYGEVEFVRTTWGGGSTTALLSIYED